MSEELEISTEETTEEPQINIPDNSESAFVDSGLGIEVDENVDELGRDELDRFLESSEPSPMFDENTNEWEDVEGMSEGEDPVRFESGSLSDYAVQGVGGLLDTAYNIGELAYDLVDSTGAVDVIEEKVQNMSALPDIGVVQFNVKGFEHYDPKKPFMYVLSDEEFDKLYADGKANYVPRVAKSDSAGANFTRDLTRVVAGLIPAAKILKVAKAGAVATGAVSATASVSKLGKTAGFLGNTLSTGALGSLFSFKPYEPRLADSMVGFVDNTPFEVTQPFFEWMQADDSNSVATERAMIMLESVVADMVTLGGFSVFAKVLKRERNLLKAEANGASKETLEKINEAEIKSIKSQEIEDVVYPPSMTPVKQKAKETILALQKASKNPEKIVKLGDKDTSKSRIFLEANTLSEGGLDRTIKTLASSVARGGKVTAQTLGREPIVNTRVLDDTNVENFINAISNEIDREARALGSIPIGKSGKEVRVGQAGVRRKEEVLKEGVAFGNYLNQTTQKELIENIAENFDTSSVKLFKMMSKDVTTVRQMDARMVGYNLVLNDVTNQFLKKLDTVNVEDAMVQLGLTRELDVLHKLWSGFSEIPRGMARSLSARRYVLPKEYLDKSGKLIPDKSLSEAQVFQRKAFLKKTIHNKGYGDKFLRHLREAGVAGGSLGGVRALRKAALGKNTGLKAYNEIYRGLLLWNLRSMTTNMLGNMFETIVIPTSRMVGSAATLNFGGMKEQVGFIANMFLSLKRATGAGFDALIHERNLLDPLRTKVDQAAGDSYRGFHSHMNKRADAGYWHPLNYVPLIVNTFTTFARGSLRILGSQDEFFKTLNYNAKALSKVSEAIPDGLTRSERKSFIKDNLAKFYDETGEATDRQLLEYSRRATYQESLEAGRMNDFHNMVSNSWWLSHLFPFIRTPANLVSRWIQRTPIVNFWSKRTKDMWNSGDQQLRAEVIGNTMLGVGMYGSALSFAMDGTITGAGPRDPEKNRMWRAAGFQPYTIGFKIGNKQYRVKYDRLEPHLMPFLFVATLHENLVTYRQDPDSVLDAVGAFVGTMTKTLADRTWLRGLQQSMNTLTAISSGSIPENKLENFVSRHLSMFVPKIINQVDGMVNRGHGPNQYFREAIGWQEKVLKNLPPEEGFDAVKHNWLTGKPLLIPSGHNLGLDTHDEEPDKYMRELLRFKTNLSPPSKKLLNIPLNGKQYSRLSELNGSVEINGKNLMETIKSIMDSPEYDFDENREYHRDFKSPQEKAIMSVANLFREEARFQLLSEDNDLYQQYLKSVEEKSQVNLGIEQ